MSYIWDMNGDAEREASLAAMLDLHSKHPVFYMSDYRGLPGFGDTKLLDNLRVKVQNKIAAKRSGRDRKGRKPAPPTTFRY